MLGCDTVVGIYICGTLVYGSSLYMLDCYTYVHKHVVWLYYALCLNMFIICFVAALAFV